MCVGSSLEWRDAHENEIYPQHADCIPAYAVGGCNASVGCRAPGRSPQGCRMLLLSRQANQREVGTLSDGDFVHCVSCGEDPRRHDHAKLGDAEGADLLCLSREIRCVETACAAGEWNMRGLS